MENYDFSYDRYIDNAAKRKQGRYTRAVSALIAIFAIFIIASASYLFVIFNTASSASAHNASGVQQQKWGATDEDVEKLAAEGYDAIALTDNAEAFCKAFLTFDSESVEDGSWAESFSSYVAPEDELVPIQENLIYVRSGESWQEVFEVHPYYASKLVSCSQISWAILPTETVNVPYCDAYVETDRCPIVRYGLNSPDFSINRYLDRYRIVFNENGKITSCKKMDSSLLQEGVDESAMAADAAIYEKARADAERQAEEQRRAAAVEAARMEADRKAKEAEEEAKAAEEEAQRKAAEEEAKKKAEAENKNQASSTGSSGSNSNSNSNSNTGSDSSGGNSNTGESEGNANGNSNSNGNGNSNANSNASPRTNTNASAG